ncbi:MAG TPA: DUF4175 family protein [Pyrinomonadaceae bacterium]
MSAASSAINVEVNSGAHLNVRAALARLSFRRKVFQAVAKGALVVACALAALFVMALADYKWQLARSIRILLFSLISISALTLLSHVLWLLFRRRTLVDAALEVERASASSTNALVTFAEHLEKNDEQGVQHYMFSRLERQARFELSNVDESVVVPQAGALRGAIVLSLIILLLLLMRVFAPFASTREVSRVLLLAADDASINQSATNGSAGMSDVNAPVALKGLTVKVVPPAYSGLGVEETVGDAPVRALAGSQIEVIVSASGQVEGATLSFNGSQNSMRALGLGRFNGTFTANASGAFETRLTADEGSTPITAVRAVEVYPDAQPEARINEPASDQLLRTAPNAPIVVRWTASDDLGLAVVTLKYIKSRGEGDSAKFTNGELSAGIAEHEGAREWKGATALDLARLDMQPGDTLVFWVEARDRRLPAANNTGRSASLAIAISAPELAKLNLSDLMPNEIGRFLLSERQIIIHTEKLHSERARLNASELKARANDIAAEQRDFKNSFNDYIKIEGDAEAETAGTGGSAPTIEERVRAAEDERTAPHMHGIPEPPSGSPTSVKELTYAIRAMWDAEDALTNADTAQALKFETEALTHLKRAQTAVRYIPPILPQSKPIDLKRRYAGELAEIKTRLEKLARRAETKESAPVRAALADAYVALNDLQETLGVSANARIGAVGRASERVKQAADRLLSVQGVEHAAAIAEAAGQLRVIESELSRLDLGGSADDFSARLGKPLALLTQAASNLFAIAESRTRAGSGGDAYTLLPVDDERAAEYFRRLNGGGR